MKNLHVLVVDDLRSQLTTLEDILVGEQYTVATARNVASAQQQFSRQQPDILLMDVNLPDGNGLTLTAQLKKQYHGKWLPVLLMSSDATVQDHLAGYQAGCDDYLGKPLEPAILLAKLAVIRHLLEIVR